MKKRTVAIQAGGRSRRMGRDKGLCLLAGRSLVEHVIGRTASLADELLITTNKPSDYAFLGLPLFADEISGAGALFGLQTALRSAQGATVLVVACDMPFLHTELCAYLWHQAERQSADVVIPIWDGVPQPLHAIYRPATCLPAIERALACGQHRMIGFHPELEVFTLSEAEIARFDAEGLTFFNANTPAELIVAEKIVQERFSTEDG